jgi:hypothetical protein
MCWAPRRHHLSSPCTSSSIGRAGQNHGCQHDLPGRRTRRGPLACGGAWPVDVSSSSNRLAAEQGKGTVASRWPSTTPPPPLPGLVRQPRSACHQCKLRFRNPNLSPRKLKLAGLAVAARGSD